MTDQQQKVNDMQDLILEALGPGAAYTEVCKALDIDTREDVFDWIIRCYDLEYTEGAE